MSKYNDIGSKEKKRKVRALLRRDGDRCWLCREIIDLDLKPPHPRSLSLDHVIPRRPFGGSHALTNLRLAHRDCNERRGNGLNGS